MKYTILTLILTCFIYTFNQAQNLGVGTTTPQSKLSVGENSQFQVDANGNIVKINDIDYSFPTAHDAEQYLKNDGNGNLTWAPASRPPIRVFAVSAFGSSDYLIDNPGDYGNMDNSDPVLTLYKGFTYYFSNTSGHPFTISTLQMSGSYNVGVTNNGAGIGTIIFTVPMDAPATLFYYCAAHPSTMNGTLQIK